MNSTIVFVLAIICSIELAVAQVNLQALRKLVKEKGYKDNPIELSPEEFVKVLRTVLTGHSPYIDHNQPIINLGETYTGVITEDMLKYHVEAVGHLAKPGYFDKSLLTKEPVSLELNKHLSNQSEPMTKPQFQDFVNTVFQPEIRDNKTRVEIWYNILKTLYGEVKTKCILSFCENVADLMQDAYVQNK